MLTKKTSKNQITLPKAVIQHFENVDYFDVQEEEGKIILLPVRPAHSTEVRRRLNEMNLGESDVEDAISWARRQ